MEERISTDRAAAIKAIKVLGVDPLKVVESDVEQVMELTKKVNAILDPYRKRLEKPNGPTLTEDLATIVFNAIQELSTSVTVVDLYMSKKGQGVQKLQPWLELLGDLNPWQKSEITKVLGAVRFYGDPLMPLYKLISPEQFDPSKLRGMGGKRLGFFRTAFQGQAWLE